MDDPLVVARETAIDPEGKEERRASATFSLPLLMATVTEPGTSREIKTSTLTLTRPTRRSLSPRPDEAEHEDAKRDSERRNQKVLGWEGRTRGYCAGDASSPSAGSASERGQNGMTPRNPYCLS